jgi:peptidoglycan biosynthesis protein MviN/MurJ (putative lipid II flippase)
MRRQLATVSVLTALAQLLGFVKLWFIARIFGVGLELDAYNLALVLPTLISSVLAGALQTGLFPVRATLAAESAESIPYFERTMLAWCGLAGLALGALLLAIGPDLLAAFSKSSDAAAAVHHDLVLRSLGFVLLLNLLSDCCSYLLAMRDRFAIAAAAPIANAVLGTLLLAIWPQAGLLALVVGTLAGSLLQVAICLLGLRALGVPLLGPLLPWDSLRPHARRLLSLGGWILPGVVFSNLVVALPPLWIASSGEGAVSAYGYAYRLHSSLLQFIFMASSTVILARFSEMVVRGDEQQIATVLRKASALSAGVGIAACAFIALFGAWTLELLFGGRFDARAAQAVSQHWLILTVGLPFAIVGSIFAKLWQAQGRPQLISSMAACSLLTLFAMHEILAPAWHQYAVSMAQSAAAASVVLGGLWFVTRPFRRALNG